MRTTTLRVADKSAFVQVGEDHFPSIFVLDQHRHRSFDDVVKNVCVISRMYDFGSVRVMPAVAVGEKVLEVRRFLGDWFYDAHGMGPCNLNDMFWISCLILGKLLLFVELC